MYARGIDFGGFKFGGFAQNRQTTKLIFRQIFWLYGIYCINQSTKVQCLCALSKWWPAGACAWPGGHALYHMSLR